jgi:CRP-like cAMP-binding protein
MSDVLREHIIKRLNGDTEQLDHVLGSFIHLRVKRNEQLLQEGQLCKYVYFIAKGCLQVYVHDKDLNEMTRDIVTENNWCSELVSFGSGSPSAENIKAVEPSELYAIDRRSFQELMNSVPQFGMVYKQILEASYANSVYRINTFVAMPALDRLKWLMEHRPGLMTRLPGKLLASYLGINKDVFSRLKARL